MSRRLFSLFIGAVVVILLVVFDFLENWTVVEHALEALRNKGAFGAFMAGVLTSPFTPLILAFVTLGIGIDLWMKERERAREPNEKASENLDSLKAGLQVKDSGNSNAMATGGSITQHLHFPPVSTAPPPVTIQPHPQREFLPVDVELVPWEGPSEKMYLIVTNRGARQPFQAQCRVLGRRNDPNPEQKMMFDLNWQYGGARAISLATGESANLLIASAGEDKQRGMEWMKLESASGQQAPESRWPWSEKRKPEYDLEIVVLGDKSDRPQSERFTLRAGSESALEMFRRYVRIDSPVNESEVGQREYVAKGSVGIPRAIVQLFVHAGGQWHSQGNAVVKGQSWEGRCWFGDNDSVSGDFKVVAVADGDIPDGKYKELPGRGCHSPEMKVRLKRVACS
ncbi:MAG: hypothetical protein WAK29_05535 [Terriglobales bacterium]